jgi:hypothetical protein
LFHLREKCGPLALRTLVLRLHLVCGIDSVLLVNFGYDQWPAGFAFGRGVLYAHWPGCPALRKRSLSAAADE